MGQPVSTEEIFSRIDVTPPYYALRDVTRNDDGTVEASASRIQDLGQQVGPITAADAARHMAIMGSVGAGLDNPEPDRHMYLAYDAEFRRARERPPEDATEFRLSARHTWINAGTAQSTIVLRTDDGAPINSLSVYYMVLKRDDFFFFFGDNQRETDESTDPYADAVGLSDVEIEGKILRATLGEITPELCPGHFKGLPAMPVAYLMSNVLDANATLLKSVLNADTLSFAVREGSVRAEALAFVGERVDVEVEFQRFSGGTYWLHSKALVGNEKSVGALHTKLRVREQPSIR
ncbi:MAG: hypothetical protein AAF531_01875 [Actinomycetota bacterium]